LIAVFTTEMVILHRYVYLLLLLLYYYYCHCYYYYYFYYLFIYLFCSPPSQEVLKRNISMYLNRPKTVCKSFMLCLFMVIIVADEYSYFIN